MTRRKQAPTQFEQVDYVQDPDFVMEVNVADEDTGVIRRVEVAYGYRYGKNKTRYVFHNDARSRHYLAIAESCETRWFRRRHRSEDWQPGHKPERSYRVAPKVAGPKFPA